LNPVSSTTPTLVSSHASRNAAISSLTVSGVNALRLCGRLIVTRAMPSAFS
jgi:hypothetical protein